MLDLVLTAVTLRRTVFRDITVCSSTEVHQHVRGRYWLHLQGQTVGQETKTSKKQVTRKVACFLFGSCLDYAWILQPWRWRQYIPLKCQWMFTKLHGITSHITEVFITTQLSMFSLWSTHNIIFWVLLPCSTARSSQCFKAMYRFLTYLYITLSYCCTIILYITVQIIN
jgi:hypothetical protein